MTARLPHLPRPAAALFVAASLALAAPAASQASTPAHHSDPVAHIALGPMERGATPSAHHHTVKHHRFAGWHIVFGG